VPPNGLAGAEVSGAALAETPAAEGAASPQTGIAYPSGGQDGGQDGGQTSGQTSGPRRQSRGRAPRPALAPARATAVAPATAVASAAPADEQEGEPTPERRPSCTLAQMRRFIKSRPYVPVHELRRRFEIEGLEDEVSPVVTARGTIYVGLPPEQAQFLGELIKAGDVGCEMLLDPESPGVVGVFPMRPVARQ
jgi:hypothetical protein